MRKYSAKKHDDWRIYDLNAEAIHARQWSENILIYSSKLKGIRREIVYLWPSQNPQSMEKTYILKQRLFTFLVGLNTQDENVRSHILHREKVPNLKEATRIIIEEESRLKLVPKVPPNQLTAFIFRAHCSGCCPLIFQKKKKLMAFIAKKYDSKPAHGDSWAGRQGSTQPTRTKPRGESKDSLSHAYCKKKTH